MVLLVFLWFYFGGFPISETLREPGRGVEWSRLLPMGPFLLSFHRGGKVDCSPLPPPSPSRFSNRIKHLGNASKAIIFLLVLSALHMGHPVLLAGLWIYRATRDNTGGGCVLHNSTGKLMVPLGGVPFSFPSRTTAAPAFQKSAGSRRLVWVVAVFFTYVTVHMFLSTPQRASRKEEAWLMTTVPAQKIKARARRTPCHTCWKPCLTRQCMCERV